MIWVILVALGVPLWLCAVGILMLVFRNRKLRQRPGNIPVRILRPGKKRWRSAQAVWVSDVFAYRGTPAAWDEDLIQVSGVSVRAGDAEEREKLHRIGENPVVGSFALAGGGTLEVASRAEDRSILVGPFSNATAGASANESERSDMSDNELDVLIAVYLIPDLAKQDFDEIVKLVEEKTVSSDGVVLVTKDAEGEVHVEETGDHLGRKGVKVGGGVGLVVGLFAPPLLAATAVGAAAGGLMGKFARKRVSSGIGEKMDEALPPGSAGIIVIYDHDQADAVAAALENAIRSSTAQIDKASAKELKAGLAEAGAGLGG